MSRHSHNRCVAAGAVKRQTQQDTPTWRPAPFHNPAKPHHLQRLDVPTARAGPDAPKQPLPATTSPD